MNPEKPLGRRQLLGTIASVAGVSLAGVSTVGLLGSEPAHATALPPPPSDAPHSVEPEDLFEPARLRSYKSRRSSSWDRTGGNDDSVPIEPGKSATLLDATGAGVVTHLWVTISSEDPMHLKNLVLRAWWDGEPTPSVEVPIGDFFGLGLGEYFVYQSELTAVASIKALNAYFKMPFAATARITVSNEGTVRTDNLYFAVDYVALAELPADLGRFHAEYRQAAPCKGIVNDWSNDYDSEINSLKNLSGKENYVFLDAVGKGHFIGVTHAVEQNQDGWFGEGDDMIFIDGDTTPTINGTGSEDYYNGAWDFGGQPYSHARNGAPFIVDPEHIGGRYCLYRWHTESPIAFEKSIRVTMEHGHANHRSDNFYSVAYWYQSEPHHPFPTLPAPAARAPKIFRVGGAGPAPLPGK
jgi:hypothetical protein